MAMDPNNFVAPAPGGGFVVYANGQQVGTYASQTEAENAYNAAKGLGGAPNPYAGYMNPYAGAYANLGAAELAAQIANNSAQQEYLRQRLALETQQFQHLSEMDKDRLAFEKAQQAWLETYQKSLLTGYYEPTQTVTQPGEPITENQALDYIWSKRPDLASFYKSNGWKVDTPEQQRAAVRNWLGMTNEKSVVESGRNPLKVAEQMGLTPTATTTVVPTGERIPTLERQRFEQETALNYLNLLANLRGPADYAQYLKVLTGTPQGLRDLVSAAAGQYQLPGFGGGAQQPIEPASIASLLKQVSGEWQTGIEGRQVPGRSLSPEEIAVEMNRRYLTAQPVGQPVVLQPGSLEGQPLPTYTGPTASGASIMAPKPSPASQPLPSPYQWNAENVARMTPTQRDLLLGYYESQGWRPEDVQALFKASLPKYAGPSSGMMRIA